MNRGALETLRIMKLRGLSVNKAAALVEYDPGTFSKILREEGGRKPGRALGARIFEQFGVGASLWDQAVSPEENADSQEPRKPAA